MEKTEPITEYHLVSSSSSCIKEEDEKVDNLLEKAWFFGNSLNNHNTPKKVPNENRRLARAPSLPVYFGQVNQKEIHQELEKGACKLMGQKSLSSNYKQEIRSTEQKLRSVELEKKKKKGEIVKMRKSGLKIVKPGISGGLGGNLSRSDSVPIIMEEDEDEEIPDEESYARLSSLIRQVLPDTSASPSPVPSPRRPSSKAIITVATQSSNTTPKTQIPSQNSIWEKINSNPAPKVNVQQPPNKSGLRRTMTSLEFDEVAAGIKDISFTKFKKDTIKSPKTPPSLNKLESSLGYQRDDINMNKPPIRKLGRTQSYSPPIPSSLIKQPTAEDMKEQIKFWARSVACNIQQD